MDKKKLASIAWVLVAAGCLVMGLLTLAGVFRRPDPNGRIIFGFGWILIGAAWLGRYYFAKRKWTRDADEDRRFRRGGHE